MDTRTRHGLMGIGLLLVACLTVAMVMVVDIPPPNQRHLILDAQGCEAARRLGLTPSPIEHGVCELQGRAALDLRWVTIGHVDILAEHLIAVREARSPTPNPARQQ